ncbi:HIT family protein [Egicoccus sp. AB-alg2]|uniref:HIT family protein n=1 Tax=Egicoccus sp. AB-alg2 TaxID=3242693 RepID=UPI00359D69F5
MQQRCVFCEIVAGRSPASVVAEGDLTLALLDILPVNEGHALVIPRRHAAGLADLREDEAAELMTLARRVAGAQRALGLAEGVSLVLADGAVAGQEVFHTHLHVVARRDGDKMVLAVDYDPPPSREALDATAQALAGAMATRAPG